MTPDERRAELVERVAKAYSDAAACGSTENAWNAAINVALEEAARVAEEFPAFTHGNLAIAPERVADQVAGEIAAAIRALKEERSE